MLPGMSGLRLRRILVPTDYSPHSRKAFLYAAELARVFSSKIMVLHVIDARVADNVYHIHQLPPTEARAQMRRKAEAAMGKVLAEKAAQDLPVEALYAEGIPTVEITRVAGEVSADLIVMGTHGATGLVQILYGSTADGVVRTAPCPVLTVNP